jgi:hypothetical protein
VFSLHVCSVHAPPGVRRNQGTTAHPNIANHVPMLVASHTTDVPIPQEMCIHRGRKVGTYVVATEGRLNGSPLAGVHAAKQIHEHVQPQLLLVLRQPSGRVVRLILHRGMSWAYGQRLCDLA